MKEFKDVLTPEQQEQLKNVYVLIDGMIESILPCNVPTADTLRIVDFDWQLILTAEDFMKNEDGEFYYANEAVTYYIDADDIPEEVLKVLEDVIDARNSE